MKRQEQLNEAWCKNMGKCSTEIMQALAFALRWADSHPHWISVEDELPEETDLYIVVQNNIVQAYWWFNGIKEWRENTRRMEGVTHWMPLPETPNVSNESDKEKRDIKL